MTRPDSKSMNYQLLKTFSRLPIQFGRSIARILAGLVNTLKITRTSKSIELNLRIALPHLTPQQRIAITEKAVRNELTSYFEFLSIWGSSNQENIARIHRIEGEQYFLDALAEKKGVVLVVPHFGTWEVMNAWCAQFTSMTILYKPVKNDDADRFVREARSREQANLVPTDESGVRQIFKALKKGETTVILPDHTPNIGGDMVKYFGVPLASSNLSAKLIQKQKRKLYFSMQSVMKMTALPCILNLWMRKSMKVLRMMVLMSSTKQLSSSFINIQNTITGAINALKQTQL